MYLDEFQTFTTLALVNMLSELRKYGLGLVLANQFMDQIDAELRRAILVNVVTLVVFRVGAVDAISSCISTSSRPSPRLHWSTCCPNYASMVSGWSSRISSWTRSTRSCGARSSGTSAPLLSSVSARLTRKDS